MKRDKELQYAAFARQVTAERVVKISHAMERSWAALSNSECPIFQQLTHAKKGRPPGIEDDPSVHATTKATISSGGFSPSPCSTTGPGGRHFLHRLIDSE
jgi:hypothetical protein